MLHALTNCTFTFPGFAGKDSAARLLDPWKELKEVLFDGIRLGSLAYNFLLFNRAVYAVRDHWSTDTWRILREMEEKILPPDASQISNQQMIKVLDNIITHMVAFIGLNRESISREQGWTLLDAGRKIEQSLLLVNMLRTTMVNQRDEQVEYNLQEAVLKSHECLVNYRYKYRAHLQMPLVLDLMLMDPNNPRSLLYQLDRLKAYISNLPKIKAGNALAEHERLILEAYTLLKLADKDQLSSMKKDAVKYEKLEQFLTTMYTLLGAIPAVISKTYFKHAQTQKQLFTLDNI